MVETALGSTEDEVLPSSGVVRWVVPEERPARVVPDGPGAWLEQFQATKARKTPAQGTMIRRDSFRRRAGTSASRLCTVLVPAVSGPRDRPEKRSRPFLSISM